MARPWGDMFPANSNGSEMRLPAVESLLQGRRQVLGDSQAIRADGERLQGCVSIAAVTNDPKLSGFDNTYLLSYSSTSQMSAWVPRD